MTIDDRYRERYRTGDTPWDIGRPDFNLVEVVTRTPIASCKALDVGCGTGDNSLWLARNGFEVTGIDTSGIALEKAKEKASEAGVQCRFVLVDFLEGGILEGAPFAFVFDRGCFHSFRTQSERDIFARRVAGHLEKGGLWLTIAGNADEHRQGPGPPRLTAGDIVSTVEPCFEILSLASTQFDSNSPTPPRAWRCLMRKR